jgi:hypothetical protein
VVSRRKRRGFVCGPLGAIDPGICDFAETYKKGAMTEFIPHFATLVSLVFAIAFFLFLKEIKRN